MTTNILCYTLQKNIVKEHSLAEDVVHGVFLKIIEKIDDIEDVTNDKFKSFLPTIVRHKSIDYLRKIKPDRNVPLDKVDFSLLDSEPKPLDMVIDSESYSRLLDLIYDLDEKYCTVIELKYIHEYSGKEISDILDITEQNVHMRTFRARKMLIKKIEGEIHNDK